MAEDVPVRCGTQRSTSTGALHQLGAFLATWHPSSLKSAALDMPGGALWRGANFSSI